MRSALIRVHLVLLRLRSCGGHIDILFAVVCTLLIQMKCYILHTAVHLSVTR